MTLTITKAFEWDCAHRLYGHKGKCSAIHGHRYRAEFTVTADRLDELGMVIDFGDLKAVIGEWLDNNWDHSLLLAKNDPLIEALRGQCFRLCVCPSNPTAEWMAQYLLEAISSHLPPEINLDRVRVYETPTSYAEVTNV